MLRIGDKGYVLSTATWPSPTIPVCWEPGAPSGKERAWVQDAVTKSWQGHSKLRFVGWGSCSPKAPGIRITVRDDGENDGPHTINLGTLINNNPNNMVLNFTFHTWGAGTKCEGVDLQRESCIRSIAVHEFGHAIGFAHEQNRLDTPITCKEIPQGPNGNTVLTPWDKDSVMNYCNSVYNNDGKLSAGDVISVQKVYGA